MLKIPFLIVAATTFVVAVVFSQTPPSTVPLATRDHRSAASWTTGESWHFAIGRTNYQSKILYAHVAAGPEWKPSEPLPLSLTRAEQIARGELRKLVRDDSGWEVTELQIRRLRGEALAKWHYVVRLSPPAPASQPRPDSFVVPISFAGEAGQITADTGH